MWVTFQILEEKLNRMSRANAGVSERSEFPDFLEALSNLLLRASYDADSWFFIVKKFTQ